MSPLVKEFPEYKLNKIMMRKLREEDAISMLNYISNPKVNKYLSDDAEMDNREEIKEMIKSVNQGFIESNKIRWAIVDNESSKVIGDCGFYKIDLRNQTGEISYRLSPKFWGRGIMSKVLKQMLFFGFEEIELNRIEASVIPGNQGSLNILENNGFKKEGVLRDSLFKSNKYYDLIVYSILKRDYLDN
jgi:ribosomal-protein-alanine N-acetyltransferase